MDLARLEAQAQYLHEDGHQLSVLCSPRALLSALHSLLQESRHERAQHALELWRRGLQEGRGGVEVVVCWRVGIGRRGRGGGECGRWLLGLVVGGWVWVEGWEGVWCGVVRCGEMVRWCGVVSVGMRCVDWESRLDLSHWRERCASDGRGLGGVCTVGERHSPL